jgi:hypothetical protein
MSISNTDLERKAVVKERTRCNGWVFATPDEPAGFCGALEGELHRLGCPYERCTKCSGQFLYCDCPEDYHQRKRVPFFRMDWQCCERCGVAWPDFFDVPDKVWKRYVLSLGGGEKLLCIDCFNLIAELTDGGKYLAKHGGAVMLADIKEDAPSGSPGRLRWEDWYVHHRH